MTRADNTRRWSVALAAVLAVPPLAAADDKPAGRPKVRLEVADAARLEVRAYGEPVKESMYDFHKSWGELRDLRPAKEKETYAGADFRALLPKGPVAVGDPWPLGEDGLLRFLRQLHPGATLKLHINSPGSRGAYALLRAHDDRMADVLVRAHAEFVLKEGFFTPGQFAGRMVVDRTTGAVTYFRLCVPPGLVNFDVNRRVPGKDYMVTDNGSITRLELVGGDPDVVKGLNRIPGLTVEQGAAALARRFYAFQAIDWVPFEEAVARARKAGKPVHVVVPEGTFDDESC